MSDETKKKESKCSASSENGSLLIGMVVLAAAIFMAAGVIGEGLREFRNADRSVNMKGLAQKDVEANLALWTIKHSATGDDLVTVQNTVQQNSDKIRSFLRKNNIAESAIADRRLEVTDLLAQAYRPNGANFSRYIISEVLTVRSENVGTLDAAYQKTGDLLKQNVSLIAPQNQSPIEYIFTGLNDIKPDMIAEATKSAREAAEQFASDSGAHIGAIKYANQGVFQILPRDGGNAYQESQSRYKTVRVVSTIVFSIEE